MPPNIAELIESVGKETTVADFKTILKGIKEDVDQKDKAYEDLNLKVVKLIEQTARGKGQEETASPEEQTKRFFQSAVKSQTKGFSAAEVYKYGGRMVRDDKEWSEGKWDIGKIPGEEKAALGTVLRGKKIASLIGNDEMNSSQIQGSLNLIDMVILSQALNEGRCRDLTGAILN